MCIKCGERFAWFEFEQLCGVCGWFLLPELPKVTKRPYGRTGCDVEGCDRKYEGRGLCSLHLSRLRTAERRAREGDGEVAR